MNKSMIMKRAWEIKKSGTDYIFGECLKMAWAESKVIESVELQGTEKQIRYAKILIGKLVDTTHRYFGFVRIRMNKEMREKKELPLFNVALNAFESDYVNHVVSRSSSAASYINMYDKFSYHISQYIQTHNVYPQVGVWMKKLGL